jgi:transcriptional regulator with XRE-family HTH domain
VSSANRKAIGRRLRWLRGSLSEQQYARVLGVSRSSLRRFETGSRLPRCAQLVVLAGHGINLNWLLAGIGSPSASIFFSVLEREDQARH